MNKLNVTAYGSTAETIALSKLLVGFDLRVDGAALRAKLRGMLDEAERDTRYSGERWDRQQELAGWLADLLRESARLSGSPTDYAGDEARDLRATGADREQADRGQDLDPEADRRGY